MEKRENVAEMEVKWGVIEYRGLGIGHCGLSDQEVTMPLAGEWYN